jgi:serine/threonine protein kinase/WD40 repeat protein
MSESSIFLAVLEIDDPAERSAFLDRACAGDSALRTQVEQLLMAHEAPGRFMDRPAVALVADEAEKEIMSPCRPEERPISEGPGTVIGPYQLLQQIGEGGFAFVFSAEQLHPVRRKVALKVLKPGMDTRQVVARFEAERQALALMDHANIARVLDGGETVSGRPYFVMELVQGIPITDYCDQNNLTLRERLGLFVSVCQAVEHAHQKGIIHRDIKPANVLVTMHDGTPVAKVIDFGIAKATGQQLTEKTLYTNYALLIGTPLYMSPEQAEMGGLDIDTRSDIYSLGILLYELLTGTTPFDRDRLRRVAFDEIRRVIREEEPPWPSKRISTLGATLTEVSAHRKTEPKRLSRLFRGELDAIVMKALEKDRDRRYETASAFVADIRRYLHDEPVQACPPSLGYRLRKLVRRHKGPVLAASLVVLALVCGIIGTTWGMIRATDAQADAVNKAKEKESALAAAQKSARDAKNQLFLALWNQARAGRFSRQMGQRLDTLEALSKAARLRPEVADLKSTSTARLRDEAIAALALSDIGRGPSWQGLTSGARAVAFDGLYHHYARVNSEGIISIRSIPDDREIRRISSRPTTLPDTAGLWFSPDGKFLAKLEDGYTLRVWHVADGRPVLRDSPRACSAGPAFSSDSRQLAVGQKGWVLILDLTTGQETKRWRLAAKAHSLAFDQDNRRLAVGYSASTVASVYEATNGKLIADLPVGSVTNQVIAWHPDGTRLAVAGSDPRIQIWGVTSKRRLATLEGHAQTVTMLSFHPDGDLLASGSWEGVVRLWHPSSGQQLMQLPLLVQPQFSSDGRWLGVAWQGHQCQLLEVMPGHEYRTFVSSLGAGQGGFYHGDINPDGRLLALGMDDGVRLWNLDSGRELAMLPGKSRSVFFDRVAGAESSTLRPRWELLTDGVKGLLRWPVTSEDPSGIQFGPAQRLSSLPRAAFARSSDGGTLAAVYQESAPIQIVDPKRGVVQQRLGVHLLGDGPHALSADGRWLASRGWHADRVRVWNARTGEMVREWPFGGPQAVYFAPDSRTLIISRGDEFSFWDVNGWKPIRRLRRDVAHYPGYVAFSPDGRLLALEMAPAVIHLKEIATGRTVARLEDPHGDRATWMAFTPDGTQLVTVAGYAKAIHVWNLRAIRKRLKAVDLDWDWPEFPPAAAAAR